MSAFPVNGRTADIASEAGLRLARRRVRRLRCGWVV